MSKEVVVARYVRRTFLLVATTRNEAAKVVGIPSHGAAVGAELQVASTDKQFSRAASCCNVGATSASGQEFGGDLSGFSTVHANVRITTTLRRGAGSPQGQKASQGQEKVLHGHHHNNGLI